MKRIVLDRNASSPSLFMRVQAVDVRWVSVGREAVKSECKCEFEPPYVLPGLLEGAETWNWNGCECECGYECSCVCNV